MRFMRRLLLPFTYLFDRATRCRNRLYDSGFFKADRFQIPIVSVGNLTMGGTGKTPIICELLRWSLEKGIRPAVVSRGYMRESKGVVKVMIDDDVRKSGDEPLMIASRFPQVPVYVAERRADAIHEILKNENVQIIFADDAFQHRALDRSLDVVVLDATEKIKNYEVLPVGRGRENKTGLCRADYIVLNKVNLVAPEQKKEVIDFIEGICEKSVPLIESEYYISRFVSLDGQKVENPQAYEKIALLSAIGNPSAFAALLGKNFDVRKHFIFRDHHTFSREQIAKALKEADAIGVKKIVVTEKDAVKLRRLHLDFGQEKVWVAELSPKLSLKVKSLYEKILELLSY